MNRRGFLKGLVAAAVAVPIASYICKRRLIKNGEHFVIDSPIRASDYESCFITNCTITASDDFEGEAMFISDSNNGLFMNNHLIGNGRNNGILIG